MISIVVPVYNCEKYVAQCLKSILNQTYSDFEIIVIDDGSSDKSYEICKGFELLDDRVKVYNKKNEGVSVARNDGIKKAKGEYIGFVDADDVIHPQMYEKLIGAIEGSVGVAFCNYSSFINEIPALDEKKNCCSVLEMNRIEVFRRFYSTYDIPYVSCCTKLISSSLLKDTGFECGLAYGEDNLVAMQCYDHAEKIEYVDYPFYFYRKNDSSATNKKWQLKKLDSVYAYFKGVDYWNQKDEELINSFCIKKAYKLLLSVWVTLPESDEKLMAEQQLKELYGRYIHILYKNRYLSCTTKIVFSLIRRVPWILRIYIKMKER